MTNINTSTIYLLYKCVVAKLGSKAGNFLSGKREGEGGERERLRQREEIEGRDRGKRQREEIERQKDIGERQMGEIDGRNRKIERQRGETQRQREETWKQRDRADNKNPKQSWVAQLDALEK